MAKRLTVKLGEQLARELERAAPARSRQRSSFVRAALRRALDQLVDASLCGGGRQEPKERRRRYR
jgi:metal-responsive CopG/Arc/MetJ family transcriptional regulator